MLTALRMASHWGWSGNRTGHGTEDLPCKGHRALCDSDLRST